MKYTLHTDPGHGWLEVEKAELVKLGIADKISGYSYMKGDTAYLEEDCDAFLFAEVRNAAGDPIDWVTVYADPTPIRGYKSYSVLKAAA